MVGFEICQRRSTRAKLVELYGFGCTLTRTFIFGNLPFGGKVLPPIFRLITHPQRVVDELLVDLGSIFKLKRHTQLLEVPQGTYKR